ncbi:MAG: anthranilate phosphoribosyltransferase [Alphaproteobacteria bacterium]|nr:anthranilate phosphoribosyltransferase [Alphaproteobacteria bacterium]
MHSLSHLLALLKSGEDFSPDQFESGFADILSGAASPAQIGALLMGLSMRGESEREITIAARLIAEYAAPIAAPAGSLDCCGTGGDHAGSLNISTAVAFVVAGCGVPVAKHGNRAASSKSGAADLLEYLGVNLSLTPAQCEAALREVGFCFLMAPHHHQILKPLANIRRELGFRTIFNLLGPLLNPAQIEFQLVGVSAREFVLPMAHSLKNLGRRAAWVVYGRGGEDAQSPGLDEVSLAGPTYGAKLENGQITDFELRAEDFALPNYEINDIRGGDAAYNAAAFMELLEHPETAQPAYRDFVLANAACCLVLSGHSPDLKTAVAQASQSLTSGAAHRIFIHYKNFTNQTQ